MSTKIAFIILQLTVKHTIKIIQVYAPISYCDDEQVDIFYKDLIRAIKQNPASYIIICGDFNAKMELKFDPSEVVLGNFRSINRNERREMLLSFLLEHNLYQMNSFFQKKEHRKWTSPDGRT